MSKRRPQADDLEQPLLNDSTTPISNRNGPAYSTFPTSQQQQQQQQPTSVTTAVAGPSPIHLRKQPNRTTKISQKLKLFPEDEDQRLPEELNADVYTQLAQIPHGDARTEAEHVSRMNKEDLARVTAYCTASYVVIDHHHHHAYVDWQSSHHHSAYRMEDLIKHLKSKSATNGASPKRFDEW